MKRLLSIILIFCMVWLCGCQNANDSSQTGTSGTTQTFSEGEYTGLWVHTEYPDPYSVVVFDQQGDKISLEITAVRGNGAQIATCQVADIQLENGEGTFEFADSFGNSGKCEITISHDILSLKYDTNEPYQGNWCIDAGEGKYSKIKELSEMPDYAPQDDYSFVEDGEEISLDTYIDTGVFLYKVVEYVHGGDEDIYDKDITLYIGEYEHDTERYENGKKIIEKQPNAHFFQEKIYEEVDFSKTGYCKAYPSDRTGYAAKLVIEFYDDHTETMYLKVIVPDHVFEFVRENGDIFGRYETSEYAHRNYNTDGGGYRRDDYEYKEYYGKSPTWTPFDE